MTRVEAPLLASIGVDHGFGCRDTPAPEAVARPAQVHGVTVATCAGGVVEPREADAIVSLDEAFPVGIVTADCVPILACTSDGVAVAAIHAGWRGLAAGVVERGIRALREARPEMAIMAVIGPHIGACCYEVDEPVLAPLRDRFGDALDDAARPKGPGHAMLDLAALVDLDLERSGVPAAQRDRVPDSCTFCHSDRFHSYRRDGESAGRLLHHIRPKRSC